MLPIKPQFSAGPLIIALLVLALFVLGQPITDLLAYDRYGVQSLESWRLITNSLVHTNAYHLALNLAGLALLWALHGEHYRPVYFIKLFVWCSLGTSIGIYYFSPTLIWYVGLSGTLHGLFLWGACMDILRGLHSGWLLILGLIAKISYEQINGGNNEIAALIDASVAIDAHLYGAIIGLLLFISMVAVHRYS